jgi:hypothetical protein
MNEDVRSLKGRAPSSRSGNPVKVVPDHLGTDWAAEIGNRDVRMKEEVQQSHENNGNHGRGVIAWGGKACGTGQLAANRPLCQRKPMADWEKDLQIRGAGGKSRKRPTPVVGMNPNGKCQLN